jgi:hypothetical protein
MGVPSPSAPPDVEAASVGPTWLPATAAEKEAVREQVGRILATAPFRNSKRFPVFLRHTVEHALSSSDGLKERTIGHEVFGRDPGYDTSQDPVVRMTAAEVRKAPHSVLPTAGAQSTPWTARPVGALRTTTSERSS